MGIYLFGSAWQKSLSAIFATSAREFTEWVAGTEPIPERIWQSTIQMVAAKELPEVLNTITHMQETHDVMPEVITLSVSGIDCNQSSPHHRPWTVATDALINAHMADTLTERGLHVTLILS